MVVGVEFLLYPLDKYLAKIPTLENQQILNNLGKTPLRQRLNYNRNLVVHNFNLNKASKVIINDSKREMDIY